MSRDPKKFGTPYDPKYTGSGKIERPQEKPQLRGCGDPNCVDCNPHTAQGGSPMASPVKPINIDMRGGDFAEVERRMMQALTGRMTGIFGGSGPSRRGLQDFSVYYDAGDNTVKAVPGPSAAYQQARSAVENWIVPAPEQAFEDIIGNDEALALLKDSVLAPVLHKELYEAYGMKAPKGALLSGPPGCGKTMFARAAVAEMKRIYGSATEFISISGTSIQSPYIGVTEGYIKAIFTFAREYKAFHGHPLLVFIDEAEVLLPDRTGRARRVAPWEESQVATFLAEMDGMQESGAFVLLATNRPEAIDEAVLRDGRCDFKITVKRPTAKAVEVILRKAFDKLPIRAAAVADLTFAALEAIYDPAMVIHPFGALEVREGQQVRTLRGKNFTLEHIVSGAMAVSVPARAVRHAFSRDKASGKPTGVTVNDVLLAVNDIFAENKGLQHAFALNEFLREFAEELQAAEKPQNKMN